MTTRRLFLGSLATASVGAAPLLRGLVEDADLELDGALELREGDVLVVRVPDDLPADAIHAAALRLKEKVWPDIVVIPEGVDFEVIRRRTQ